MFVHVVADLASLMVGHAVISFIFLAITVLVSCSVFSRIFNISVDIIDGTMTFITYRMYKEMILRRMK